MKNKYIIAVVIIAIAAALSACTSRDSAELISLTEFDSSQETNTKSNLKEISDNQIADTKTNLSENGNSQIPSSNISLEGNNNQLEESKSSLTDDSSANKNIYVYICGAVSNPNVYEIRHDARIVDVVNLAGGLVESAASEYINLASPIMDGQKIYIPTYEDIENGVYKISDLNSENYTDQNIRNNETQSEGDNKSAGNTKTTEGGSNRININTASETELMTIPGIGQSKASKIIAYRDSNGGFAQVEDIMFITGIKEGMFNKIKDYITVE